MIKKKAETQRLDYKAEKELELRLKITQGELETTDVKTKYKLDENGSEESESSAKKISYDEIFLGDIKNKFANELIFPCNCKKRWHRRCIREFIVQKEITECEHCESEYSVGYTACLAIFNKKR